MLKQAELHVHVVGCLYAQDLAHLAADCYRDIDWTTFCQNYQRVFGHKADPVAWFEAALKHHDMGPLRRGYIVTDQDRGDFARFQARFDLLIEIARHLRHTLGHQQPLLNQIFTRHRQQGLRYVEYRALSAIADTYDQFAAFHGEYASACLRASNRQMTIRYIASLPRNNAMEAYGWLRQLLKEQPVLKDVIVGIDFCFWEEGLPPRSLKRFFEQLHAENQANPDQALGVVYHVAECYFDKSLESAIRWCHEAAILGAKRLGHAIALGMDPAVSIGRKPRAHTIEPASERLDQIDYDLKHAQGLCAFGVKVDQTALHAERDILLDMDGDAPVVRAYDSQRLEAIRCRQDYVLAELCRMGTVIETCPTSNLRIGDVPTPADHPVHRFLSSGVNLLIAADDPGIFDVTLASEVDWVAEHAHLSLDQLLMRLGDPMRFALRPVE